MKYYPVNLDINQRKCLVVGGGEVGARKAEMLVDCNAEVVVVSPVFEERITLLAKSGKMILKKQLYHSSDLDGMFLVISATGDKTLNRKISEDAEQRNVLCNIADFPEASNFILPSVITRGDLLIAISTSGKSPAFAKQIRQDLEKEFGEEYAEFLLLMGAIRKKLLNEKHEPEVHRPLFEQLISCGLLEMIKQNRTEDINSVIFKIIGKGYKYEELIDIS